MPEVFDTGVEGSSKALTKNKLAIVHGDLQRAYMPVDGVFPLS